MAAEAALATGDPFGAASAAQAVLDQDPYDEYALRLLMTAHARAGRAGAALAAYAETRELLEEALGASPSALTEELHLAILRDEIEPTPSGPPGTAVEDASLPGREAEWPVLDRALDRATTGVELVIIEGEPGIGKTHLLEAWSRSKAGRARVLWGTGDPIGAALPFQPVLDALEHHLARVDDPEAEELRAIAGPVLGPLLPGHAGAAVAHDPLTAQAALFRALLQVCCRAANERVTILVLDDVHLADATTRAWLGFVAKRPGSGPLLVLAALRPEATFSVPEAARLTLGPLDLAAASRIVGSDRAPALLERSGGNPLFLVELAGISGADLPASILEAVSARAAQSGSAEQTLRTAAVLGPEVDLDLLAGVMHGSAVDLLRDLEAGQRLMILEERELAYVFRHELVREALVAGTSASRRALAHREAALLLAARPRQDHLLVAAHARRGGNLELAAHALVDAAAEASARFDHGEAERLLSDSLELFPLAVAFLERGRVRLTTERFTEAVADADEASALGARAEPLELASWAAYYRRDFDRARLLCAQAQAALGDDDRELKPSILALAGRIAHADGDLATAQEDLESAVAAATALGRGGVGQIWLGWLMTDRGEVKSSRQLVDAADADPLLATHPFAQAHRALLTAYAAALQGDFVTALTHLDTVDHEVEVRHLGHFAGRTANYRAWLLRNLLFESEADELNLAAAEIAGRLGLREAQAQAALDTADAHLRRGRLAEAATALELVDSVGTGFAFDWKVRFRRELLGARLALSDGRCGEASARAEALEDEATKLGTPRYATLARALVARSRALNGEGDPAPAGPDLIRDLSRYATPEAWWITAELARDLRIDGLWSQADRLAGTLAAGAGPRGEAFDRQARRRLERMRSSRLSG